jgi:transposase
MSERPAVRLRYAVRDQVVLRCESLDQLLPPEHPVRSLWAFVCGLDLSAFADAVGARVGQAGAPAFDPRILLTLWLQATLDGEGSARELQRLCTNHLVYRWACGEESINYHTLADFRVRRGEALDDLLTQSAAALCAAGVASLQRVAQDGIRVRASAGASSFRREATLEEHLTAARAQVAALKAQVEEDKGAASRRSAAARTRAAADRVARLEQAQAELVKLRAANAARAADPSNRHRAADPSSLRASATDPEARKMKMADGGFRPAFNVQLASTTVGGVVVGVAVTNAGTDGEQLEPMVAQVKRRYGVQPSEVLVDGGFASLEAIARLETTVPPVQVYAPVKDAARAEAAGRNPYVGKRGDPPAVAAWRVRMGTEEARRIYRERGATAEWVNAEARRRGLQQFGVRGLAKVKAVVIWQALAQNVSRARALRVAG